jgi:hypothetical protein
VTIGATLAALPNYLACESLLRISGDLRGNSLETLVRLTKGTDSGIEGVFARSLNLITKPLNVSDISLPL